MVVDQAPTAEADPEISAKSLAPWHIRAIAFAADVPADTTVWRTASLTGLTLLAGQGSHMAMADAFVLARELERHGGDHDAAFAAYQAMMKPPVDERQRDAAQFARYFIPGPRSRPWLRRLVIALLFSPLLLPLVFRWFGAKSVLKTYA